MRLVSLRSHGIVKGVSHIRIWTCVARPTPCPRLCAVMRHIDNESLFSWNVTCPQKREILHHFPAVQYVYRCAQERLNFQVCKCSNLFCKYPLRATFHRGSLVHTSFAYIMCTSILSYSLPMAHYTDPLLLYTCCSSVYFLMCTYVYVSLMGGGEEGQKKESTFGKNETINVFSIASGHLYERFLRYIHT